MRILFLSNYYPPFELGGWDQLTWEMAHRLADRGHQDLVLTSNHNAEENKIETDVRRSLRLQSDRDRYSIVDFFFNHRRNEKYNQDIQNQTIDEFHPDIFFVQSMWNLSRRLPALAEERLPGRVVYFIAGDWPYTPDIHENFWNRTARRKNTAFLRKLLKSTAMKLLASTQVSASPRFEHVIAVSHAVKVDLVKKGRIPAENIRVIYNGIDPQPFLQAEPKERCARPPVINALCAGALARHKGFHTAIEAVSIIKKQYPSLPLKLTILGSGDPGYESELHRMVDERQLRDWVQFKGWAPRQEIPSLLYDYDIFILPSLFEAMSRMLQEAMVCRRAVIGTASWGSVEILEDGVNSLTFQPEDAAGLANQLQRLAQEPDLRQSLGDEARRTVLERFTIERMILEIEADLQNVMDANRK